MHAPRSRADVTGGGDSDLGLEGDPQRFAGDRIEEAVHLRPAQGLGQLQVAVAFRLAVGGISGEGIGAVDPRAQNLAEVGQVEVGKGQQELLTMVGIAGSLTQPLSTQAALVSARA